MKSFYNTRNSNLQYFIRNKAWEEDSRKETVVYLLKDGNTIAYYFTLKCGLLLKNGSKKKHESFEKPELINHQFFVNATMPAVEIAQFCLNEKWLEKHKIAKGCGKIVTLTKTSWERRSGRSAAPSVRIAKNATH